MHSLRTLLKSPLFLLAAVVTLGLGIGASTTVFSVLHSIVLRPLDFREPDRLLFVRSWQRGARDGNAETGAANLAGRELMEFRQRAQSFQDLAGMRFDYANLTKVDQPTQVTVGLATATFFEVLGVPAALGRTWKAEDCLEKAEPVVVLSHSLWQKKFGGDPAVIGRTVTLNERVRTVIGVMPKSFKDPFGGSSAAWLPVTTDGPALRDEVIRWFGTVGRLKPEVGRETAATEVRELGERLGREFPVMTGDWRWEAISVGDFFLESAARGFFATTAAAFALLLITCFNVAGLMVARSQQRRRETAVRAALGASFPQLVREALKEGGWIALLGGVLGATLAFWGVELTKVGLLPSWFPRTEEVAVRPVALVFVLGVSALAALGCALVPLLHRSSSLSGDLRRGAGQSLGAGASRLRRGLVVAEIALAVLLLSVAMLALRSFFSLRSTDLGARTDHVLALTLSPRGAQFADTKNLPPYYASLLEKIRTLPGVERVGLTSTVPFLWGIRLPFGIEGRPVERGREPQAFMDSVNPDFFDALAVTVRRGRLLQPSDSASAAPVCVVSEAFARAHFPGQDPVGQRVRLFAWRPEAVTEIVGVVGDVRRLGAQSEAPAQVYVPFQQKPWYFSTILVRTSNAPENLQNAVQRAIWSVNADQALNEAATLEAFARGRLEMPLVWLRLFAAFAVLALLLAAVGIYGLMAYVVSQRTREFGIRLALGAQSRQIFTRVLAEGGWLVALGSATGLLGAFSLAHLLRGLIFGVGLTDPISLLASALVLAAVALAATALPARKATRVDPILALRSE